MLKFFLKNLRWFFLAALLLSCIWLLSRGAGGPSPLGRVQSGALALWLPLQRSVTWLISFPEATLTAVRELRNLKQEVNRLQLENQHLRLELSNHKSLESQLARLENVLRVKPRFPRQAKIAKIIAHDPSTWNSSFVIDLGSEDGVLVDSPVISEQGIVGRILKVAPRNSRVLLLTDKDSSVAGIDERSRVTGIVVGLGHHDLKLSYVGVEADVQRDDRVLSSGMGGIFPEGYAIGTVVKREPSEDGLSLELELVPAVDFASLDYVFVLPPIDIGN